MDISLDLTRKVCQDLIPMGARDMILTGEGEPFLHPHLLDLISIIKASGFRVTLITNGTFLDEASIRFLVDAQLDILKVSFWASSPEEYEQSYPQTDPGNFERVVDGLKRLSILKSEKKSQLPSVVLHQPIHRHNFKKVHLMVDLASITGSNALSFSPLIPSGNKLVVYGLSRDEENSLFHSFLRMKKPLSGLKIRHNIDDTLFRYRIGEAVWQKLPCYIAWIHSCITVDGMVLPCSQYRFPIAHLEMNSFNEIWNSSAYRTFRRQALTRKGPSSLAQKGECGFCCYVRNNWRIHQVFRWLSPFMRDYS